MRLSDEQIQSYHENGYVIISGILDNATCNEMIEHYMDMSERKLTTSTYGGDPNNPDDPLNKHPRPSNMHEWDEKSAQWSNLPELCAIVGQIIDDEPVLQQTMLYYKPPLARGQALHQDQQYITIDPLVGVWIALDDSDHANGRMCVIPGSHKLGLQPVEAADMSTSFVPGQSKVPEGAQELGLDMKAGDALFFDGKIIHGSHPNTTTDRFRRSFICHFIGKHSKSFEAPKGTHMSHLDAK